jgi:hypothetical protein
MSDPGAVSGVSAPDMPLAGGISGKVAPQKSPLKAIRARCLDCRGFERASVADCQFTDCPLSVHRMGHGRGSYLRSIRAHCLWCCKDQPHEVRLCPAKDCPTWPYRLGHRPKDSAPAPEVSPKGDAPCAPH